MATFTRLINIFVSFKILGLGGEPEFGGETVLVTADNLVSDIDDDDDDDIIETQFVVQDNFDATAAGDQTVTTRVLVALGTLFLIILHKFVVT